VINNQGSATFENLAGGRIDNPGSITNALNAKVINHAGAALAVTGSVASDGTITNAGTVDLSGSITGIGTYTQTAGLTKLHGGTIEQSLVDIQGGSLLGAGRITGAVHLAAGAALGPGDPNVLTISGPLTVDGGTLLIQIAGAGQFDRIAVTGALTLHGATIEFDFLNGYVPTAGTSFVDVVSATAGIGGLDTASYQFVGGGGNQAFRVDTAANGLTVVAVDEPSGWLLLGVGLPMMAFVARRRRHRQQV
jgi:hypothetical protein